MFNSSGRRDAATTTGPLPVATGGASRGFSVLGSDVVITGNITATADLHIDGRIEGDVACGALVQGSESIVIGGVTAESARIAGTIEGKVAVRQLQIESSARISGDVEYEAVTIASGARVEGNLRHRSAGTVGKANATNITSIARTADVGEQQAQLLA